MDNLTNTLKKLNKTFNDNNKIKDAERSLFFSGLMIALKDNTFRSTYRNIEAPTTEELSSVSVTVLESSNLNTAILEAITRQLKDKINNLSKTYSWKDRFSFIKNVDYSLSRYKSIISLIEEKIFNPYQDKEKEDILGKAYKIFLSRAGKIDNKNIILTPDHIKSLMVELSKIDVDDVIIDTCTGTGGFLMEGMEALIDKANGNVDKIENIKEKQLIGFEIDSVLFSLACSNMFLHGDGRTNLLYRSSLLNEGNDKNIVNNKDEDLFNYIKSLKPNKCIINPPYENNNSLKFTLQALKYLETNGKLIIIMPTPTLNQGIGGITDKILKMAKLDFVIKMPYALFTEQGRSVNTSVFGFTKTPHNKSDEVLFYNLEDDGFESIQHKGRLDVNGTWNDKRNLVLNTINNSKEIDGVCEKRIIFKNGNLNCSGFTKSKDGVQQAKVSSLFNIVKGDLASKKGDDSGYNFITAAEEWKKHSQYHHDKEAIVYAVSAGGSLGRSHYVNGKFTASNLCFIITPKNNEEFPVNLKFYNYYLNLIRKQLVSDLASGTSKLTISESKLKNYYINYVPKNIQDDVVINHILPHEQNVNKFQEVIRSGEENINGKIKSVLL